LKKNRKKKKLSLSVEGYNNKRNGRRAPMSNNNNNGGKTHLSLQDREGSSSNSSYKKLLQDLKQDAEQFHDRVLEIAEGLELSRSPI
jgi:hypothetical protein